MKRLIFIAILTTAFFCKAQTNIIPLGSGQDYEKTPDYYRKDVNNEFGKFEGTWVYTDGNTELTFKLKKEEHYQTSPDSNYLDFLVGEYRYIENGEEKANTLVNFDNVSIKGYSHKISGRSFLHRLPGHCTDNSDVSEVKIGVHITHPTEQDTEGRVILRYVNDNGVEKLEACIYNESMLSNDPNASIDIPDGNYVLIKQ